MALLGSKPVTSTPTSVFDIGPYELKRINVDTTSKSSSSTTNTTASTAPPKPLFIFTPTLEETYPVILFLHGFYLSNTFYSQLLQHIASHGYIVVAPQLYQTDKFPPSKNEEIDSETKVIDWLLETQGLQPQLPENMEESLKKLVLSYLIGDFPPRGEDEIRSAIEVTDWLLEPQGLQPHLPENVKADLQALALVGHSRGGKTAFSLAINDGAQQTTRKYSVLVGIDPVAGLGKCCQIEPKILTYEPKSFNISIPITVIGTGLGSSRAYYVLPPCCPDGVNHKEFFNECKPPRGYFVTEDYGHMDMLDDDRKGIVGYLSRFICKNTTEEHRDPMRKSIGGIVVAFLRAYLQGHCEDLVAIVDKPNLAPAKLCPATFCKA